MIQDKLEHDERLRLECIAQAVASTMGEHGYAGRTDDIINRAKKFEEFVRSGS